MPDFPKSRDDLRALAKRLGRKGDAVFGMSATNDPWAAEDDYRAIPANWFAELFRTLAIAGQFHIRRIFYRLVSQKTPTLMPDGQPFENTANCSEMISEAIRDARYLGLLSTDLVIDRRNPPPTLNLAAQTEDTAAELP
jgi:hypothetical protein